MAMSRHLRPLERCALMARSTPAMEEGPALCWPRLGSWSQRLANRKPTSALWESHARYCFEDLAGAVHSGIPTLSVYIREAEPCDVFDAVACTSPSQSRAVVVCTGTRAQKSACSLLRRPSSISRLGSVRVNATCGWIPWMNNSRLNTRLDHGANV